MVQIFLLSSDLGSMWTKTSQHIKKVNTSLVLWQPSLLFYSCLCVRGLPLSWAFGPGWCRINSPTCGLLLQDFYFKKVRCWTCVDLRKFSMFPNLLQNNFFWRELSCYILPASSCILSLQTSHPAALESPHWSSTQPCLLSWQTLAFNGAFWAYKYFSLTVHSQPANPQVWCFLSLLNTPSNHAFWACKSFQVRWYLWAYKYTSWVVPSEPTNTRVKWCLLSLRIRESSGALWTYKHCRQPCVRSLRIFQPCEPMNTRM